MVSSARPRFWSQRRSASALCCMACIMLLAPIGTQYSTSCRTRAPVAKIQRPLIPGTAPGCSDPSLRIIVLTATRHQSLSRLLSSISAVEYGCSPVDLQINVDISNPANESSLDASHKCVEIAHEKTWAYGSKQVFRRIRHAGLSQSWFESTYSGDAQYTLILEDDMEVSPHFYKLFSVFHIESSFMATHVTGFCLHPSDWEVEVKRTCDDRAYSRHLYLSPEPCNWGPVWKTNEWAEYIDWVFRMKASGELPYVPDIYSYEFNAYLRSGKDVQSSWVWAYNFETGKRQARYSFTKCSGYFKKEIFLAVNHKEPGEHFKKKSDELSESSFLQFDYQRAFHDLLDSQHSFTPFPFDHYEKGQTSLRVKKWWKG